MRKFPILGVVLLLPAFALFMLVGGSGCTKPAATVDKDKDKDTAGGKDKDTAGGKKTFIEGATTGKIVGVVKLKGDSPAVGDVNLGTHPDKTYCMMGDTKTQTWMVKDGAVANVVVSLAPSEHKKFKVTDSLKEPFKKPVVLDQPFCAFVPHVVAVLADVQELEIKNSSGISHNTKIIANGENQEFNKTIGKGEPPVKRHFKAVAEPTSIVCDMHTWMSAKMLVFNHPYFAVTKDDGKFEIANVPVGEELTVYIWHEATGKKEAKKMSFKAGDNQLDLEISAK